MVLVAIISALPTDELLEQMLALLRGVAPPEVVGMLQGQMQDMRGGRGGLVTFGILVALWSSSTALVAVIGEEIRKPQQPGERKRIGPKAEREHRQQKEGRPEPG